MHVVTRTLTVLSVLVLAWYGLGKLIAGFSDALAVPDEDV